MAVDSLGLQAFLPQVVSFGVNRRKAKVDHDRSKVRVHYVFVSVKLYDQFRSGPGQNNVVGVQIVVREI